MIPFSHDLNWWISVIEIPLFSAMFWLFWKERKDIEQSLWSLQRYCNSRVNSLKNGLMSYKLEVSKDYARSTEMKELENRLTSHLLRIEAKLEATALKAEALEAHTKDVK